MKRAGNLYEKLISDENLLRALEEVNRTHRWHPRHKANRVVAWVESDLPARVQELREILERGFEPSPAVKKRRWDKSAGKWREISEPKLWPDQYIHHAVIQTLEPVFMRGMDRFCCGSIRGRGIHYGAKAMKKWMATDKKGTKYGEEADIYHFYDNLTAEVVMARLRQLVKDRRMLDVCQRVLRHGVLIGGYFSQWFANVVLQPLDQLIRQSGLCDHYLRYIDNFTIFGRSKRKLRRLKRLIDGWLGEHGLRLNGKWQIFPTKARLVTALGYRYGRGYTLLRKRNLFRLKRQLGRYYKKLARGERVPMTLAAGLLSRLGQLRHCNSVRLYHRLVRPKTQRGLKDILRAYMRKERARWSTSTAPRTAAARCGRT